MVKNVAMSFISGLFSRKTHVANGYQEVISAKIVWDRTNLNDLKTEMEIFNAKAGVTVKLTKEFCDRNGFLPIAPNTHFAFDCDGDLDGVVYVSIVSESGRIICPPTSVQVNRSVIVDAKGFLRRAKYRTMWQSGNSEIWVEEDGTDHRR